MTAPGHTSVQTPIAGLVELALTAPTFTDLIERAGRRPDEMAMVGPASARLFVAAALARPGPLLVVTATGREADDLTAELRGCSVTRWRCSRPGRRCRTSGSRPASTPSAPG